MTTESAPPADESTAIARVASGQRLVIYAILTNFAVFGLVVVFGPPARLVGIIALVLSLVGIYRLASGLGYSMWAIVPLVLLMILPLVNLIVLLVVNSRATKALRANGYTVGFFGASR